MDSNEMELEALLREDVAAAIKREQTIFDNAIDPFGRSLVLFGAGTLGCKVLRGLRQIGIEPLAFADNNARRWNTMESGLPILSPEEAAARFGQSAAFIITVWGAGQKHRTRNLIMQLETLGCRKVLTVSPLFWKFPEIFLPHYGIGLPHVVLENAEQIRSVFASLGDNKSRAEFLGHLKFRLLGDFGAMPESGLDLPYWPHDIIEFGHDEHFVDCGAFDGDTIRELIQGKHLGIRHITAFEPDPSNYKKLSDFVETLPAETRSCVDIHHAAVGRKNEIVRFNSDASVASAVAGSGTHIGHGNFASKGTISVQCVALDNVLRDQQPTYIKMDIEGFEIAAIEGARNLICTHHPILAICVYHLFDDLWSVPVLISSIWSGYRFYLRAYNQEGYDVVCYAVPPSRTINPRKKTSQRDLSGDGMLE